MTEDLSTLPTAATAHQRPTLHDVARVAGVSYRTVSRVVNGERFVAPATARAVERAVSELGFQRNDMARMLKQGAKTETVGLIIEDLVNPFYARFSQSVAAEAMRRGYVVMTASGEHDPDAEREAIGAFLRRRVDGLMVFPASDDHGYLRAEIERGTPMVFVDAVARGIETDAVVIDNRGGARKAVEHLIEHGHRRVGLLVEGLQLAVARERLAGYQDALSAAGIAFDPDLVHGDLRTTGDARLAATTVLSLPDDRRPTALFTANNRITIGTLHTLHDGTYPDIALIGFGDFETAGLLSPGISVVRQDPGEMAAVAARLLFERLAGARTGAPATIRLPVELVRRGSGERPPST